MMDAIVIGAGPNGLSAAIVLAQAGCKVSAWRHIPTAGTPNRTRRGTRLGEAYFANHEPALAHRAFMQALAVRKRIEHPGVADTEK